MQKPLAQQLLQAGSVEMANPGARQGAACPQEILATDRTADRQEGLDQGTATPASRAVEASKARPMHVLDHVTVLSRRTMRSRQSPDWSAARASRDRTSTPARSWRSGRQTGNAARHTPAPRGSPCARGRARRSPERTAAWVPSLWMSHFSKCSSGAAFVHDDERRWMIGPRS